MTLSEQELKEVLYVLNYFDANKVAKVMEKLEWKWYSGGGVRNIPSEGEIREHLSEMLIRAAKETSGTDKEFTLGSAGIYVSSQRVDGKLYLKAMFIVEEWDNYD